LDHEQFISENTVMMLLLSVEALPEAPGIYAIINRVNEHRYVGKAFDIRERVLDHLRDLDAGNECGAGVLRVRRCLRESGERPCTGHGKEVLTRRAP
jgi:hypothetical protein